MGNFFGAAEAVKRDAACEDCWVEVCGCQSEDFGERRAKGWGRKRWEMGRKIRQIRRTRTEKGWRRRTNKKKRGWGLEVNDGERENLRGLRIE
jgi:hypothetical protein